MEVSLWVTIISDVACAIIGGIFGVIGKTYSIKRKEKKNMKQKAGDNSTQIQVGGDYNGK
jgi:hypothetical protein